MAQQVAKTQEIERYGPYGRQGQPNFNGILEKTDVIKTVNIKSGYIVDGIGFQVLNQHGNLRTLYFGGNGGVSQKINLRDGERITQISGFEGEYKWCPNRRLILRIKIHTNLVPQGYGPYGGMHDCSNVKPFKAHDPMIGSVIGFFGFAGVHLDSIGVIVSKDDDDKVDLTPKFLLQRVKF